MITFICAGCDAEDQADELPKGWTHQQTSIGGLDRCQDCSAKIAPRLVSSRDPDSNTDDVITGAAQGRLRTLIERIERVLEDIAAHRADLSEIYAEAKGEGFDTKILRKVIRLRAMDPTARSEETALIDLYMSAAGD
jgi:uncharacterized protein (UPF0335 family)